MLDRYDLRRHPRFNKTEYHIIDRARGVFESHIATVFELQVAESVVNALNKMNREKRALRAA